MQTSAPFNLAGIPGLAWNDNGQSSISGALLRLEHRFDAMFQRWAAAWAAAEHRFPTFVPACELAKLDYFHSFPQLVTFPTALDASDENLKRFSAGKPLGDDGVVTLTDQAPIRDVLTPAACYHFYILMQGQTLDAPRYLTTRATCFRREAYYAPLQRQWGFSMREIVCIGSAEVVKDYLATMQERVGQFFQRAGLNIAWENATDPFFNPSRNPKYLAQKLDPVKTEMVFDGHLAIGSVNFHRNYFGEAFRLQFEGEDAFSGCVAFGLERWLFAWLTQFGADERAWPDLEALA